MYLSFHKKCLIHVLLQTISIQVCRCHVECVAFKQGWGKKNPNGKHLVVGVTNEGAVSLVVPDTLNTWEKQQRADK